LISGLSKKVIFLLTSNYMDQSFSKVSGFWT